MGPGVSDQTTVRPVAWQRHLAIWAKGATSSSAAGLACQTVHTIISRKWLTVVVDQAEGPASGELCSHVAARRRIFEGD